jgi:undecaprenyl-diphosphatase
MRTKQFEKLSHFFLVMVLGYLFVLGIKYYIDRPRPYETHPELAKIFEKVDPSFPSAHTFLSFLALYFIPKKTPKLLKYCIAAYLVFLVPLSVMYAGVHYPSDVLFGAIIGLLVPKIISENFAKKAFKF